MQNFRKTLLFLEQYVLEICIEKRYKFFIKFFDKILVKTKITDAFLRYFALFCDGRHFRDKRIKILNFYSIVHLDRNFTNLY